MLPGSPFNACTPKVVKISILKYFFTIFGIFRYRGIGIRIEDEVLITDTGYEVISANHTLYYKILIIDSSRVVILTTSALNLDHLVPFIDLGTMHIIRILPF